MKNYLQIKCLRAFIESFYCPNYGANRIYITIFFFFFFCTQTLFAQHVIRGQVFDDNSEPLIGLSLIPI